MFFGDFADRNKYEVELPSVDGKDFAKFIQAIAAAAPSIYRYVIRAGSGVEIRT